LILANRLGLALPKREGHDLAGPCITCESSDAFRLHMQTGVAHCYSCGGKWSPFQVAELVTGDRGQATNLLVAIGLFTPGREGNGQTAPSDPIKSIARQKGVVDVSGGRLPQTNSPGSLTPPNMVHTLSPSSAPIAL